MSAEGTVVRNYIETLIGCRGRKNQDQQRPEHAAQTVLDEDHFGLDKVKERILEYLAVQQRGQASRRRSCAWSARPAWARPRWAVDCPRGQPSVRAHGAGGVRDEAEIAATAAPISARCRASAAKHDQGRGKNPLFLLDEVDKWAHGFPW